MHYYQHHIGDFIRDTARLSDAQCMAYLRLIWMYYESEEPLANNIKVLALKIGADEDLVTSLLEAFFTLEGDAWRHTRCDSEIAEYNEIRERNKANGMRGGRPKETQRVSGGMPPATDAEPSRNPNQEPITNISIPDGIDTRRKSAAVDRPPDVNEKLWADFLAIRKAKRAPMTQTALKGIQREAMDAGMSLPEALTVCCERGWQGFKAQWLQERPSARFPDGGTPYQRQMRQRVSEATGGLLTGNETQEVIDVTPTITRRLG